MDKDSKLVTVTFCLYIGVALLIGYRMYKMEDGPSNSELLEAIENGAANATREHFDQATQAATEVAEKN